MDSLDPAYFSRLPLELVYEILRHAARAGATSGTPALVWSMSLPLVSRTVREEVTPILYHTLVVSEMLHKYRALMANTASQGMLRLVRRVYIYRELDEPDSDLFAQALAANCKKIRAIHAPLAIVERAAAAQGFSATEIQIVSASVGPILQWDAQSLRHVTHLSAVWPNGSPIGGFLQFQIATALPALTHLALRFVEFRDEFQPFNIRYMLHTLRDILRHQGIRRLIVELTGQYLHMRLLFEKHLGELKDARVRLSVNKSVTCVDFQAQAEEDALHGRGRMLWQRSRAVEIPY